MEHVKRHAQKALLTSSTKSPRTVLKTPLAKHWVVGLFKKMQARYLHKWTSAIDGQEAVAVQEWSDGLAGITPEQLARGLDEWSSEWPPSLPEFRDACLGLKDGKNGFGLNYVPHYYRDEPVKHVALERKPDVAIRNAAVKKMREIIKR